MKWHVLRPLWVAIALIGSILIARVFLVPDDFGIHGRNFTYGFYRLSDVQDWKDFPVKYQGRESCAGCHAKNFRSLNHSPHAPVECENCHGPGINHPDVIAKLPIDTTRELCLRCHASLGYPHSAREQAPQINDRMHMRRRACSECHNPHKPQGDKT
jgi:hypothetical protein